MDCSKIQDLILGGYIDGELDDSLRHDVEKHIVECPGCREFKEKVQKITVEPFKEGKDIKPPDSVWRNIKAAISEEEHKQPLSVTLQERWREFEDRLRGVFPVHIPVFATATVLAVILIAVVFVRKPANNNQTAGNGEQTDVADYLLEEDLISDDIYYEGFDTSIENYLL